jgi:chorismate dehydratase
VNWRIGCVPYLNAKPLIYGIEEHVTLATPAELAERLRAGEFDAALVPIVECFGRDQYEILSDAGIVSHGIVQSVILAHRAPISMLKSVAVMAESRTSAWLLRVILREKFGVEPKFFEKNGAETQNHDALMLIGDDALAFAAKNRDVERLDLGAAWQELTGLPFVYAMWAMPRGRAHANLCALLRKAKADGQKNLRKIARNDAELDYLTRSIQFDVGPQARQGIEKFREFLRKWKWIETNHDLRYVN